jgi:hypothetical protein
MIMKYVLLGTLGPDWATRHGERIERAKAKLAELGIKLESVYYTQVTSISSTSSRRRTPRRC